MQTITTIGLDIAKYRFSRLAALALADQLDISRAIEAALGLNGPSGSPVFACAGKTDPPSLLNPLADLGG